MPRKPVPCRICGEPRQWGSLTQDPTNITCLDCRRMYSWGNYTRQCIDCGTRCVGTRCHDCEVERRRAQHRRTCTHCGTPFSRRKSGHDQMLYCSRSCANRARHA